MSGSTKKRERDETTTVPVPVAKKPKISRPEPTFEWFNNLKADLLNISVIGSEKKPFRILLTIVDEEASAEEMLLEFSDEGAARRWHTLIRQAGKVENSSVTALTRIVLDEKTAEEIVSELSPKLRGIGSFGDSSEDDEDFLNKLINKAGSPINHAATLDILSVMFFVLVRARIVEMPTCISPFSEMGLDKTEWDTATDTIDIPWEAAGKLKFDRHIRVAGWY